jgi:hypothetical protein
VVVQHVKVVLRIEQRNVATIAAISQTGPQTQERRSPADRRLEARGESWPGPSATC